MKTLRLLILAVALTGAPLAVTGCKTPPSERVVAVQTLLAVGHVAEATVALSADLYFKSKITAAQARDINAFYDLKFQPAYRMAVLTTNGALNNLASPEIANLAAQLSALLVSFQKPTP